MSDNRSTPLPMVRIIPKRVRGSLPSVPTLEQITRALADECRAYDDASERTNAAYTALVRETAKRSTPLWVRLGAVSGMVALGISCALLAWRLCAAFGGPCR